MFVLKVRNRKLSVFGQGYHRGLCSVPFILFLLFINDLPDNIKNKLKLFADDLKLIEDVSSPDTIVNDLKEL